MDLNAKPPVREAVIQRFFAFYNEKAPYKGAIIVAFTKWKTQGVTSS